MLLQYTKCSSYHRSQKKKTRDPQPEGGRFWNKMSSTEPSPALIHYAICPESQQN